MPRSGQRSDMDGSLIDGHGRLANGFRQRGVGMAGSRDVLGTAGKFHHADRFRNEVRGTRPQDVDAEDLEVGRREDDPSSTRVRVQSDRIQQLLELARLGRTMLDAVIDNARLDASWLPRFRLGRR